MEYYVSVLKKYAVFEGRARRREFWMFYLWNVIVGIALGIVDAALGWDSGSGGGVLSGLYSLAVLIPSLAVACRRLHDTNRSGWWQLLWIIPVVGWIILIIWWATDGNDGDNQYGSDPKAGERMATA